MCLSFLLLLFCLWRGVAVAVVVVVVVVVVFSVFGGVRRPSLLFVLFSLLNDFNHLYIYKIIKERKKRKKKMEGGWDEMMMMMKMKKAKKRRDLVYVCVGFFLDG